MVQRKFVMRRDTRRRKTLKSRAIGMGRVLGATSVYLRGLLADHFGVGRKDARWITAEALTSDAAMGGEWAYTHQRGGMKASELIQRLSAGELDAVIYPGGAGGHWFNWVVEGGASRTPDPYGDLEQMVASNNNLCFPVGDLESHLAWFNKERIYPTYHFLGIRKRVAANHAGLTDALVDAFQRATSGAPAYMSREERKLYEREQELLGLDPNECGLNAMHRKTMERCLTILRRTACCRGARRYGISSRFPKANDGGRNMKVWLFLRIGYPRRIPGSYLLAGKDYDRILGKEIYDEVVDFLRGVEGYGFDGIFFPEHHSRAANGLSPSPNLFVAMTAVLTRQMKIGLMGNCLPLHHPVRWARSWRCWTIFPMADSSSA